MWFLVTVVKGNRNFETESQIGNRVLISDTTEMVISARSAGGDVYRFEARKGNESFIVSEFVGKHAEGVLAAKVVSMAQQMGAVVVTQDA